MSDHADTVLEYVDDTELFLLRGGNTDPRVAAVRDALDALVAERDRWRAVACNVKDGTAAAEAERDRLREALTEAKAQIGHGAFCNCVVCLPLIAALAAPTSKEGT